MSARWAEAQGILEMLDPVLVPGLLQRLHHFRQNPPQPRPMQGNVVLVGHRAAGKSTILQHVAAFLGRPAVDLDRAMEHAAGAPVKTLFNAGEDGFRMLEREVFNVLSDGLVVAAGGGFLAHHGDTLMTHTAVLVPVSLRTYKERLVQDVTRPRLLPQLPLEEELERIHAERDAIHARVPTLELPELLAHAIHSPHV